MRKPHKYIKNNKKQFKENKVRYFDETKLSKAIIYLINRQYDQWWYSVTLISNSI